MKKLFAALAIAALTGCATFGETPAQKVFAATSAYDTALSVAVAYKRLPACTVVPKPLLCSDKAVVATIQRADNVAFEALKSAQTVVRTPATTQSALQTAVLWAQEAISAFSRVTASLSK